MKKHLILLGLALLGLATVLVWNGCKKDSKSDGGQFTCKITSPKNGAELSVDEDITVTIEAKGAVAVTAYLDGEVGGAAMTEPFTMTISSAQLSPGSHTIKAIAVTKDGKQAEASITVTLVDEGGEGDENESPSFVTFANGEIPPSWKTNTWVVDIAMGYDDDYSLRADNAVASVVTKKTMNAPSYVEFYIRGEDFFEFYIDNTKAQAFSSASVGNNWGKWVYIFEKGTHSFRWENTNGSTIHLDAIKFAKATLPKVTTTAVTNITATSAISAGNVTDSGNNPISARGVCWSTSENPTIDDNKTTDGTGTGNFTGDIFGLTLNTTYYVRAYATNGIGTSYGEQVIFTTDALKVPTVTTGGIYDITSSTAECGGDVTHDGYTSVTARGVCWSTSQNPTIDDNKTTDGKGTGSFTSKITGLNRKTLYYVRAYATNSAGTAYGEQKSFTPKFALGEKYQGGIIAYIDNTGEHGLIAAKKDQSTGIQWHNGSNIAIGASGTAIGTGKSNTTKIVQVQGNGSYAAKLCDNLVIDGYDDWFLPSKDELNILYQNRYLIGGFTTNSDYDNYYWSSSEYSNPCVWRQDFKSGEQKGFESLKSSKYRVRAVREF